ncbi:MAG: hypothetical protein ACTH01_13465 [Micrococcaceae bacterium]
MRRTTTMTTIAALGGAVLLLAGCSGGSDASTGTDETGGETAAGVYEFQINGIEPAEEITIRVPNDLREAMGSDADGMVVDQIVATAHDVEGVEYCAVDLAISYTDGQPDNLIKEGSETGMRSGAEQELLEAFDVASLDDVAAKLDTIIAEADKQGTDVDMLLRENGYDVLIGYYGTESHNTGKAMIDYYMEDSTFRADDSGASVVASALGLGSGEARAQSDLDESAPKEGTYVSDDLTTVTRVGDCAASATDPDNAISMTLPSVGSVELSVMTDGTIGVAGEVDGYMRDSSNNWIKS